MGLMGETIGFVRKNSCRCRLSVDGVGAAVGAQVICPDDQVRVVAGGVVERHFPATGRFRLRGREGAEPALAYESDGGSGLLTVVATAAAATACRAR